MFIDRERSLFRETGIVPFEKNVLFYFAPRKTKFATNFQALRIPNKMVKTSIRRFRNEIGDGENTFNIKKKINRSNFGN